MTVALRNKTGSKKRALFGRKRKRSPLASADYKNKLARIKRTEARQRSGSQYARAHVGEPGRNGGPKGV